MEEVIYEIKREWMETYLELIWDVDAELAFEGEMLTQNEPEGIISFTEFDEGADHHIKYRVTGKKPLNSVFRAFPMKEAHLRKILGGLIDILERGEEYLLCGDSFLLKGDTVFVDVETFEPQLIYVPGYKKELSLQMGQLMEFMLNHLDYDDKLAVNLLYDCFAGFQSENGGLEEIRERLNKAMPGIFEDNEDEEKKQKEEGEFEPDRTYLHGIFSKIKNLFVKKEVNFLEEEEYDERSGDTVFLNKNAYVYERGEDVRTVFLSEKEAMGSPWLVDVKTAEVIKLQKTPFSLGSLPEYNDYVLNDSRVSRLHAAITETEGRVYLMDLNSTNGTYVNNKEVLPGHDEQLFNNDKIRLADREFIYKSGD